MSEDTRFEARIGSTNGAGLCLVAGRLSRYALDSLREVAMHGVSSLTITIFDLAEQDFASARDSLCRQLACLTRRGVELEVTRA